MVEAQFSDSELFFKNYVDGLLPHFAWLIPQWFFLLKHLHLIDDIPTLVGPPLLFVDLLLLKKSRPFDAKSPNYGDTTSVSTQYPPLEIVQEAISLHIGWCFNQSPWKLSGVAQGEGASGPCNS